MKILAIIFFLTLASFSSAEEKAPPSEEEVVNHIRNYIGEAQGNKVEFSGFVHLNDRNPRKCKVTFDFKKKEIKVKALYARTRHTDKPDTTFKYKDNTLKELKEGENALKVVATRSAGPTGDIHMTWELRLLRFSDRLIVDIHDHGSLSFLIRQSDSQACEISMSQP